MPSLKDLVRSAHAGDKLYVAPKHAQWIETPEHERPYSEKALDFVQRALRGEFKHERSGRISPSSLGECRRRVAFGFYGAPQDGENLDSFELMGLGTWGHLRWQAEGITSGWMEWGEIWTTATELRLGGSMDGLLADGSIFELKTAGMSIYSKVVTRNEGMLPKWRLQTPAYLLMSDRQYASQVVEERSSGQFHEFRVKRNTEDEEAMLTEVREINRYLADEALPPMLDDCKLRRGKVFHDCPYRTHCPTVNRDQEPIEERVIESMAAKALRERAAAQKERRAQHAAVLARHKAGETISFGSKKP